MASVIPITAQAGFVRHSCGEMNPPEAHFCGGCGCDLTQSQACATCGDPGSPGARFCHGCGARLVQDTGGLGHAGETRLAALENDVDGMREEMESLLTLKAQLDGAMQRMRQRGGGGGSRPSSKSAPERPRKAEEHGAAETAPNTGLDGEGPVDALAPAATSATGESDDPRSDDEPKSVAVIHVEDRPNLQVVVETTIARFKAATYHSEASLADGIPEGRPLLVVNLLGGGDPLTGAVDERLSAGNPRAFVYATDGTRGFTLGVVDLFPAPFEPSTCAARILASSATPPRVLIVSEAVLGTPELRGHLVRQGCTTSIAFDERQALGLIPSVRPNLVLIDLNLPRGEGLRLAGRVRADEHNRGTRIAFMWQKKIEAALFRQLATRAAFDFHFAEDDLRRFLLQEFNPGGAAYIDAR